MMTYQDRSDAGRRLAKELSEYRGRNAVVLALPRGGVPVAAEVAAALDAPLDLILVRKIGVPTQPGATQLTRMPRGPSSAASDFV